MWQESDSEVVNWWKTANPLLAAPTTTSSTSPTGQTIFRPVTEPGGPVSTISGGTTPSSTSEPQPAIQSSDLSTGAKIGIGVSIGVAMIAVGIAVYFFIRFMRASKSPPPPHDVPKDQEKHMGGLEMETRANAHEFEAPRQVFELPTATRY